MRSSLVAFSVGVVSVPIFLVGCGTTTTTTTTTSTLPVDPAAGEWHELKMWDFFPESLKSNMSQSYFFNTEMINDVATVPGFAAGGWGGYPNTTIWDQSSTILGWTCGNLVAPAEDNAVFFWNHLGPTSNILNETTVKLMVDSVTPLNVGWAANERSYGLGLMMVQVGAGKKKGVPPKWGEWGTYLGHGGDTYGFLSEQGFVWGINASLTVVVNHDAPDISELYCSLIDTAAQVLVPDVETGLKCSEVITKGANLTEALAAVLNSYTAQHSTTAVSLGFKNVNYSFGLASGQFWTPGAAGYQPTSASDKFLYGSGTKPFTAVAVMSLVESGKVNLDDSLGQHIDPVLDSMRSGASMESLFGANGTKVTVGQVLGMTSGINDFDWPTFDQELLLPPASQTPHSPLETLDYVATQLDPKACPKDYDCHTFVCEPGTCVAYSSTNYVLAGLVLVAHMNVTDETNLVAAVVV